MADCVQCNAPPAPCACKSDQTCVQTPRTCSVCPQNICLAAAPSAVSPSPSSAPSLAGTVAGALGGLAAALALVALGLWLHHRSSPSQRSLLLRFRPRRTAALSLAHPHSLQSCSSSSSRHVRSHLHLSRRLSNNIHPHLQPSSPLSTLSSQDHGNNPFGDPPDIPRPSVLSIHPLSGTLPSSSSRPAPLPPDPPTPPISIPVAYIPPSSKSLSIGDLEDRDGLGNPTPQPLSPSRSSSAHDDRRFSHQQSLIDLDPIPSPSATCALRSSFIAPATHLSPLISPPPPSVPQQQASHQQQPLCASKPVRPPRAPGLDLRLPSPLEPPGSPHQTIHDDSLSSAPKGPLDTAPSPPTPSSSLLPTPPYSQPRSPVVTRHNLGSNDTMPAGATLSLASSHQSPYPQFLQRKQHLFSIANRPASAASDTTHDSHLSSILDPAMIVTPVTLVRTASGRQAAVQRVALRGQEKARVVRLAPNASNSSSVSNRTSRYASENTDLERVLADPEILSALPPTPGRSISVVGQSRLSSTVSTDDLMVVGHKPHLASPLSSSSGVEKRFGLERVREQGEELGRIDENPFTDGAAVEVDHDPAAVTSDVVLDHTHHHTITSSSHEHNQQTQPPPTPPMQFSLRHSGQKAKSNGGASVTEAGEDEDGSVVYAKVVGGARTGQDGGLVDAHHRSLKSIGRDRTISLSSMISAEGRAVLQSEGHPQNGLPPPMPEPFKPFAGQRPNSGATDLSVRSASGIRGRGRRSLGPLHGERLSGMSGVSGMGSLVGEQRYSELSLGSESYGSVLEGIPFNIGFNSERSDEDEDGFGFFAPAGTGPVSVSAGLSSGSRSGSVSVGRASSLMDSASVRQSMVINSSGASASGAAIVVGLDSSLGEMGERSK